MKQHPTDTKPFAPTDRDASASERDDARERRRERQWRIGATQMAAPPTRTWRRAGRYGSSAG